MVEKSGFDEVFAIIDNDNKTKQDVKEELIKFQNYFFDILIKNFKKELDNAKAQAQGGGGSEDVEERINTLLVKIAGLEQQNTCLLDQKSSFGRRRRY